MSRFFSILLYLAYKAAVVLTARHFLQFFTMRYDLLVLLFYGFLSSFQFAFLLIQSLPGKKVRRELSAVFQYTTVITVYMELALTGLTSYYLFRQENDLYNLLFLLAALTPAHTLFYFLHTIVFDRVIRKLDTVVTRISSLPVLGFILSGLAAPAAYLGYKILTLPALSAKDLLRDVYVTGVSLASGLAVLFFLFWLKALKARRILKRIKSFDLFGQEQPFRVDDPNEIGLVQSALNGFAVQVRREKEKLSLFSGYLSRTILDEVKKFGPPLKAETKSATVATILYSLPPSNIPAEDQLDLTDRIVRMLGEYAENYDAYPLFSLNRAVLVFGVPFHYDHRKLNAIESSQKIVSDFEKMGQDTGVPVRVSIGIYSGQAVTGPLSSRGKDLREYSVLGDCVETSERIALAASGAGRSLLVCPDTLSDLQRNFPVEKSFKIRLRNRELVLHQLKT